jgi:hypothetical protein
MPYSWDQVRAMTDAEVIENFDRAGEHLAPGAGFWRDELLRRYSERVERRAARQSNLTMWLTAANVVVAVVAAVAAILALAAS